MIKRTSITKAYAHLIKGTYLRPKRYFQVSYKGIKNENSLILQTVPMERPYLSKFFMASCEVFIGEKYISINYGVSPSGGTPDLAPGDDDGSSVNVEISYDDIRFLLIDGIQLQDVGKDEPWVQGCKT